MKKLDFPVFAAVVTLMFSCSHNQGDKQLLMVSIDPQKQILEQIAGPAYKVETLLSRGANPETFDPSTAQRMAVDNACIFFATGVFPYENTLAESSTTVFVDTSNGVDFIYGTHSHSHHGDGGDNHHDSKTPDPHYWSSIEGAKNIASNMARAMIELYPDSALAVNGRLNRFNAHCDSLKTAINHTLASHYGRAFAVWHPSLSYFAREFGLKQISLGIEGKELSAKGLADAVDKARQENARVFFSQQEYDSRQAVAINDALGSHLVTVNSLDYDWEGQLKTISDEIARAQ